MAWRIHSWNASTITGEVASSHFGPLPFEGAIGDSFAVGEDVLVELVGDPKAYRVRNVRQARQPQPDGTRTPELDALNMGRHEDCHVEEQSGDTLKLWLGDCCTYCGPSRLVTFRDVTSIVGLSEHGDLDAPLFRLASEDERRALVIENDATAFCIVTNHGNGRDGPSVFVVARAIDIEAIPAGLWPR